MGERADVWDGRRVRARKQHMCDGCHEPICIGTVHDRIGCLADGSWSTLRVHLECHELARQLSDEDGTYDVCDLRGQVTERWRDVPGLVQDWRDLRRARRREQQGRANLCAEAPREQCAGGLGPGQFCDRAIRWRPADMWGQRYVPLECDPMGRPTGITVFTLSPVPS